jgi:peroxiredoxin
MCLFENLLIPREVAFKTRKTMAFTESTMLPLGTAAPDFSLPDTVSGRMVSLSEVKTDKGLVVMFLCNHCPYVIHVNPEIVRVSKDYMAKGLGFVGISSNDVENYPDDAPDKMKVVAEQLGYPFPYLYDESQEVARAYDAACTPDFYVFDQDLKLVYRGRLDDSRPKNDNPLTGKDLRAALDAVLAGEAVSEVQYPSGGCNIKWKKNYL